MASVAQPRLRVLLGLLSVAAGRVVTAESLVDGLWGEEWSPGRERTCIRRCQRCDAGWSGHQILVMPFHLLGPDYRGMEPRRHVLGPVTVSRVGFGAMQLPGPGVFGPPRDRAAAIAVLRRAVELGVDHTPRREHGRREHRA